MKRLFMGMICIGLCVLGSGLAGAEVYKVAEVRGSVEKASGPDELVELEARREITPRALMAFGQLPAEFMGLALDLRAEGVDLLSADTEQIERLVEQVEAGEIRADPAKLRSLVTFLDDKAYLGWEPVQAGQSITARDLLKGLEDSSLVIRGEGGEHKVDVPVGMLRLPAVPSLLVQSGGGEREVAALDQPAKTTGDKGTKTAPMSDLSLRATGLREYWATLFSSAYCPFRLQGEIDSKVTKHGVELHIPLVDYGDEGQSASADVLRLSYTMPNAGAIQFTAHPPQHVWLHDTDGLPIGLLRYASQEIAGTWAEEVPGPIGVDAVFKGTEFLPDVRSATEDASEVMRIDRVKIDYAMDQGEDELWSGQGRTEIENIRFIEDEREFLRLAGIEMEMEADNQDLKALSALMPALAGMSDVSELKDSEILPKTIALTGPSRFTLTLSDLEAGEKMEQERLQLGRAAINGQVTPSAKHPGKRDVRTSYKLSDFRLETPDSDFSLQDVSFSSALTELNMEHVLQFIGWGRAEVENPLQLVRDLLSGVEYNLSLAGLSGHYQDVDLSGLDSLSLGIGITGLNTSIQNIALSYEHSGLAGMEGLPPGLTPERLALGGSLSRLPILELGTAALLNAGEAQSILMDILSKHGTRLELDQLDVALPGSGITARGLAFAQGIDQQENTSMPLVQIETDLEIRGIDALAENAISRMDDDKEIEDIKAMVAFVKLVAEEKTAEDGTSIHALKIVADTQGTVTANGKDLGPLLQSPNRESKASSGVKQ